MKTKPLGIKEKKVYRYWIALFLLIWDYLKLYPKIRGKKLYGRYDIWFWKTEKERDKYKKLNGLL